MNLYKIYDMAQFANSTILIKSPASSFWDYTVPVFIHLVGERRLETKGIEPSFPRCDRGVLPLHHVPGKHTNNISQKMAKIQCLFFISKSKFPFIVAQYFFDRQSCILFARLSRIAKSHQFYNSYILRN